VCVKVVMGMGVWCDRAYRVDLDAEAERYFDRIEEKARPLQSQPRMDVRRTDIRPTRRMLVEARYLLLHRTDPDTDDGAIDAVEIVRVLDGRRDIGGVF
jgi:toxin ParE1/3/4